AYLRRKLDEIYLLFYLSPKFIFNNMMKTGEQAAQTGKLSISLRNVLFKSRLAILIAVSYAGNLIREMAVRARHWGPRPCGPAVQFELPVVDSASTSRVQANDR